MPEGVGPAAHRLRDTRSEKPQKPGTQTYELTVIPLACSGPRPGAHAEGDQPGVLGAVCGASGLAHLFGGARPQSAGTVAADLGCGLRQFLLHRPPAKRISRRSALR